MDYKELYKVRGYTEVNGKVYFIETKVGKARRADISEVTMNQEGKVKFTRLELEDYYKLVLILGKTFSRSDSWKVAYKLAKIDIE